MTDKKMPVLMGLSVKEMPVLLAFALILKTDCLAHEMPVLLALACERFGMPVARNTASLEAKAAG